MTDARGRGRPAWARLRPLIVLATVAIAACGESRAAPTGDADDIVVAADPALAGQIRGRVTAALAPDLFAIPNARAFQVTFHDPTTADDWARSRTARQLVLIGKPDDAWMADAVKRAGAGPDSLPAAPALVELEDVWANDQQVMVVVVPDANPARAVYAQLDSLGAGYERRYRSQVIARMFEGGTNQALSDSLMSSAGFEVSVPEDYEWTTEDDVRLAWELLRRLA